MNDEVGAFLADDAADDAPGAPGMPPNWCGGAKQMVGTTLGTARVWFTVGDGIVNEVFYPRVDIPQIRDLGFIVADGNGFWQEVKRLTDCEVTCADIGIPAVTVVHRHKRFTLTQRIVPEPDRDTLLIQVTLDGDADLRPYVLLAPRLGGSGNGNVAEVGDYRGRRVLWASQGPFGLALAAADPVQHDAFGVGSAGFAGESDGWQDFDRHGTMRWRYRRAGPGNVALMGALPRRAQLALGFAESRESAATLALSALAQSFDSVWTHQVEHWRAWHRQCGFPSSAAGITLPRELADQATRSAMVLRTHCDQTFRGAMVASLSVPWGEHAEERPGYHLVWPRDLCECAGALLAMQRVTEAQDVVRYLIATQRDDGAWFQNQWLGGKPYWTGIQLDQIAFPVLLAGTLADRGALDGIEVADMVRRALGFIARNGPATPQDRWEENSGVNAFTMAACIAALVSGARFLPSGAEGFALELADYWNARIEDWTAVRDTALAQRHGVRGYYLRIAPPAALLDDAALARVQPIKNRRNDPALTAADQVGVDFLQLVRYGLRDAQDPMVLDTLQIVDALLRVDLPQGPCWYRFTGDGYGEHADGSPYDGVGRGRLWPLLTGERGHYDVCRGSDALPTLRAMAAMAGTGGMLPEQVWDSDDMPENGLRRGGPTGSAMPLAWAHAEYIKLACSILEGRPVDRPEPLWARYHGIRPNAQVWYWSPSAPIRVLRRHARLGFVLPRPSVIVWRVDDSTPTQTQTRDSGLGAQVVVLPTLPAGAQHITFEIRDGDKITASGSVTIQS